jgi:H+-translocating NAD(P) transhydrogenase subunit alpha
MAAGSVVVDMGASELGGNVLGSQPGETTVTENGVSIIGASNLPSRMPAAASAMYARNISSLLLYLVKDGALAVDLSDDLQRGVVITYEGRVVHPALSGGPGDAARADHRTESAGEGSDRVDGAAH